MRIFNSTGEKLYQEWVLRFCAKETKGQGAVPFNLLTDTMSSSAKRRSAASDAL